MKKQIFYDVRLTSSEMVLLDTLLNSAPALQATRELKRKLVVSGHFPIERFEMEENNFTCYFCGCSGVKHLYYLCDKFIADEPFEVPICDNCFLLQKGAYNL